jgi:hypothetical protein
MGGGGSTPAPGSSAAVLHYSQEIFNKKLLTSSAVGQPSASSRDPSCSLCCHFFVYDKNARNKQVCFQVLPLGSIRSVRALRLVPFECKEFLKA